MTVAALALAAPEASATSTGFRVPDRPDTRPQVVCATNLLHRSGLYCASPFVKPNTYDGLGVLRPSESGHVTRIQGGNDILLAIEGDLDQTGPRPTLSPGHAWSANGYRCTRTTTAVRCRRGRYGFTIPAHPARRAGQNVATSLHISLWPNGRGQAPKQTHTLTCVPTGTTTPRPSAMPPVPRSDSQHLAATSSCSAAPRARRT